MRHWDIGATSIFSRAVLARTAIILLPALLVSACGNRNALVPPSGATLPNSVYGEDTRRSSEELLKPSSQKRPERSDELLRRSEKRRDDKFDLPPEG